MGGSLRFPPEGVALSRPYCDGPGIREVVIPEGVERVGAFAFRGCSGVSALLLPGTVVSVGPGAFAGSGVTRGEIRAGVEYGELAYACCGRLEEAVVEGGVTAVPSGAFSRCSALASLSLPLSLRSIGERAFSGCASLASLALPPSLASIGAGAFSGCASLASLSLPPSLRSLGEGAFSGCAALTSLTLPPSLASVGAEVFSGCASLRSVDVPEGVVEIGSRAFADCPSLTSLGLPRSLRRLCADAFVGCGFLDEGTPAELFDLRGVEIFWSDGTVIPEEWVAAAYEQVPLLSREPGALSALNDCWREVERREEALRGISLVDERLRELDDEERRVRDFYETVRTREERAAEAELARANEEEARVSWLHPLRKMSLQARSAGLSQDSRAASWRSELRMESALSEIESRRERLREEREGLERSVRSFNGGMIDTYVRIYRFPRRWVDAGRTIPESAASGSRGRGD